MSALLENWRNELYTTGNFNHEELKELESHLLDEIEGLDTSLLSDQEKVLVASHRLGSITTLNKAYQKEQIFDFQRISIFAQVFFGIMSFIAFARASLFVSLTIQQSIGWTDSLSLVIIYYSFQLVSGIVFFILTRHWLKMSIKFNNTVKANLHALLCVIGSYGLLVLSLRFSKFSSLINAPFLISGFSTFIYVLFFIGFAIVTARVWIKRRKSVAVV